MSKKLFKWVQISDIHFQPYGEGFNTNLLRQKLEESLKSSAKDVDALIITGDYRYAPLKESDVKPVANFVRRLSDVLEISSSMEKLVIVPGNHDLNRDGVRRAVIKEERASYTPEKGTFDKSRLDYLQKGFEFYRNLSNELNCSYHLGEDGNPHKLINFEQCKLLLLNTAITAGDDEDEHKLIIGSEYLRGICHNVKDGPIIAIGHHGFELLNEKEKKTCIKYLEDNNIFLYLCGHSHNLWVSEYGKIKQINVGCLKQDDNKVDASFSIGTLYDDGTVQIENYRWNVEFQSWHKDNSSIGDYFKLYEKTISQKTTITSYKTTPKSHPFSLKGLTLLGSLGVEGVKYHWIKNGHSVESLAFNRRLKENSRKDSEVDNTSAYTISVSYGCQLSAIDRACKFCETGKQKYYGNLSAEDIALQSIFMAEYDSNCPSFPQVRNNMREFAFMGQGEPGLTYPAVREAIMLTEKAMDIIDQKISRHIISTCGIDDFLLSLIDDIIQKRFHHRVTLHFSLHLIGEERNMLMPINYDYDYKNFIKKCSKLREISGEKIGVGILMFNEYQYQKNAESYTLDTDKLAKILEILDKDIFKIDLCTLNNTKCGKQKPISYETAQTLLDTVIDHGFEGKIFSSFGENVHSGCGMLNSNLDDEQIQDIGNTTIEHFNASLDLLEKAKTHFYR